MMHPGKKEWALWVADIKRIAPEALGYKVGEIDDEDVIFYPVNY